MLRVRAFPFAWAVVLSAVSGACAPVCEQGAHAPQEYCVTPRFKAALPTTTRYSTADLGNGTWLAAGDQHISVFGPGEAVQVRERGWRSLSPLLLPLGDRRVLLLGGQDPNDGWSGDCLPQASLVDDSGAEVALDGVWPALGAGATFTAHGPGGARFVDGGLCSRVRNQGWGQMTFHAFDADALTFKDLAPLPNEKSAECLVEDPARDRVLSFGSDLTLRRSVLAYSIAADEWTSLPDAPVTLAAPTCFWIDDRRVLVAQRRHDDVRDPLVWTYAPDTGEWRAVSSLTFPQRGFQHMRVSPWEGTRVLALSVVRHGDQGSSDLHVSLADAATDVLIFAVDLDLEDIDLNSLHRVAGGVDVVLADNRVLHLDVDEL